jgi:hypothetical protein
MNVCDDSSIYLGNRENLRRSDVRTPPDSIYSQRIPSHLSLWGNSNELCKDIEPAKQGNILPNIRDFLSNKQGCRYAKKNSIKGRGSYSSIENKRINKTKGEKSEIEEGLLYLNSSCFALTLCWIFLS